MVWMQTVVMALAVCGTGDTVLLDFSATWCKPCRQMDPTIHRLTSMGFPVRKVDIDRERALASKYRVRSIPCFVMLVNGREVDRAVGATSFGRLEKMCKMAPPQTGINSQQPMLAVGPASKSNVVPIPVVNSNSTFSSATRQASATVPLPSWKLAQHDGSKLIAATVRLRIKDTNGHSCGTGTIIDSREGQALILTCGHIFRDSKGQGRIEVDLFGPASTSRVPGRLISYDLQRDVALLSIKTPGPVVAAKVAPRGYRLSSGDPVINVGCNNGAEPTARHSRVSSIDKFLGPSNIQVAGVPVEGRSGGGLFSADGLLLGVCNAADPADQEGLYAALKSVYSELERAGLTYVCETPAVTAMPAAAVAAIAPPPMAREMPKTKLRNEERAALDEIRRRQADDAEVICIIRSRSNPTAKSEIFVLDRVSPAFLDQLSRKVPTREQPHETSLEIPRRGQKTLTANGWQARPLDASK